jgi:hypothetical protein
MAKILIACEESQAVCKAFRNLGHEAFSCDTQKCSGDRPEWHIQADVLDIIGCGDKTISTQDGNIIYIQEWDLIIAHPPCTYLSRAGCRWLFPKGKLNQERYKKGLEAKEFFMKLYNAYCKHVVVENPVNHKVFDMPKETQIIQPYQFGHEHQKATCLWIKGLPNLKHTNIVEPEYYICKKGWRHSKFCATWNAKDKSKTFLGIAKAMAEQWGKLL